METPALDSESFELAATTKRRETRGEGLYIYVRVFAGVNVGQIWQCVPCTPWIFLPMAYVGCTPSYIVGERVKY